MLNDGGFIPASLHQWRPSEKKLVHGFVNISSQVDAYHPFA